MAISALHPIHPDSAATAETEHHAPWVVRKLAEVRVRGTHTGEYMITTNQSLTGRIVMSVSLAKLVTSVANLYATADI